MREALQQTTHEVAEEGDEEADFGCDSSEVGRPREVVGGEEEENESEQQLQQTTSSHAI